ncbi:MAG: SGNH/GDSL hydrolase family protein [Microcystaceae cyanobacterium]
MNIIKIPKQVLPLPVYALKSILVFNLLILLGFVIVEKQILPNLESQSQIVSQKWQQEDQKINKNNANKNLADDIVDEDPNWIPEAASNWMWRSKGFPVELQKTTPKRILVMGDSFVWGDGYANMNDIWWRQLQRELNRRGYSQVEVIAGGLKGASTRHQFNVLKSLNILEQYQPDLMILGYVTNDPDEGMVKLFRYIRLYRDPALNFFYNLNNRKIFPKLTKQLMSARRKKLLNILQNDENGYEYGTWKLKLLEGKSFEKYKETIKELGEYLSTTQIPSFFITLPNSPNLETFKPHYAKVQPLFEQNNIPFLNLLDDFVAKYPKNEQPNDLSWGINPANGHPGTISTYFYAIKAADFIEKNYPEALGEKDSIPRKSEVKINDWMPAYPELDLQRQSSGVYTFEYPESQEFMLSMPNERPYVQLNLENEIDIKEIRLSGNGLNQAVLEYTSVDPQLGYDTHQVYSLAEKTGNSLSWNLENEPLAQSVNTLRLSADFKNVDRQLTLTIIQD